MVQQGHDECRRRAQRIDARGPRATRCQLRAAREVVERSVIERRAKIVGQISNAAVGVVAHAARIGPAPLRAHEIGSTGCHVTSLAALAQKGLAFFGRQRLRRNRP